MEDQKYRDEEDLQEKLDSFKSKDSLNFLNTDIVHTCWCVCGMNAKRACVGVCACVMDLLSPYGLAGMCWSCPLVVVLALRVLDMCFLWEREIMVCVCVCGKGQLECKRTVLSLLVKAEVWFCFSL